MVAAEQDPLVDGDEVLREHGRQVVLTEIEIAAFRKPGRPVDLCRMAQHIRVSLEPDV